MEDHANCCGCEACRQTVKEEPKLDEIVDSLKEAVAEYRRQHGQK